MVIFLLVFAGVEYILHSDRAHRYILNTAQQKASDALGSQVQIGNYALNFSGISPTLDLYSVVVAGADPYPAPPLLRADHIRVAVRITSLLQRKWYLQQVQVDHPVAYVFTDKQGKDNLPQTKTSGQKQSNTDVFSLGVRHAVLTQGEVYYNNRKSVIDADLHSLEFKANYHAQPLSYSGSLAYENGHLRMANYRTINHNFHADFVATPSEFQLKNAVLQSGSSRVILNATLHDYSQPKLSGTYRVQLNGGEFRSILKNSSIPTGMIDLAGSINYAAKENEPAVNAVQMSGTLHSNELVVHTPKFTGPIRNLGGNYTLNNGNFQLKDLHAQLLGGQLHGELAVKDVAGAQASQLQANLSDVSLAGLKAMFNSPQLKNVGVKGTANAQVNATWKKSFSDVQADLGLDLNSQITPPANFAANQVSSQETTVAAKQNNVEAGAPQITTGQPRESRSIPVTGHVEAHYSSKGGLTVKNSSIHTPSANLAVNGSMTSPQGLKIDLNKVDLHQLAQVAAAFSPAGKKPSLPEGLSGTASFNGTVKGTTAAPRIQGMLLITNLHINNSDWRLLKANIDASPSHARLLDGTLLSPTQGRATFALTAGLQKWSFTKGSTFQVAMNGSQLHLPNLLGAANVNMPAKGSLSFTVNAHGTQAAPVGSARMNLGNAIVSGQPIQSANVNINSDGQLVRATLGVRIPAGSATGNGSFNLSTQDYQAQLQALGIKLNQLHVVQEKALGITGELNVRASGQGKINNPQLDASVEIPKLQVKDQTVNNIALHARVANHVADVTLGANAVNTSLRGQGRVQLTGDYQTVASLDTQAIPFAPLVAVYAPSQAGNITGQAEIHATLRGPLKKMTAVEAQVTIPTLQMNYKNAVHIGAPQPIRINYTNGVLDLQRAALTGTGTNLQFQGRVPVVDRAAPVSLLLQGTVDLRLAQLMDPNITSSGQVQFDINSYGQRSDPNVQGQVRVVNANFATGSAPLGLQNGNGVLNLTRTRLEIQNFQGEVGGGRVVARGGVTYRPAIGFDLAMTARNIRLLFPENVRSGLGANLTLTGTPEEAYLRGQVNLRQLSFTPDFDLMSLMGSFGGGVVSPPPSQSFADNLQLDIHVSTPNGIDLSSRELTLSGGMNLNVRGTANDPVILGRVNLPEGDLIFRGNRYLLQSATLDFVNPTRTQPVVNATINTTIQQYDIAMRFEGPVDHLRTNYTSDPALPPADIINLLAFGKTTEAAAANPNPPGTLGAQSAIASAVAGQVTSRLAKVAGISQLSVDPTLGGNGSGQKTGATVTIQQRVTSKIFVTFSTDVTSTQREVMQLEYRVTPRFAISGTRDQNGGFAVDTKINKQW